MAARLGRVLYWLGCGLAAIFVIGGVGGLVALNNQGRAGEGFAALAFCAVLGAVAWGIGRACRYVLTGE